MPKHSTLSFGAPHQHLDPSACLPSQFSLEKGHFRAPGAFGAAAGCTTALPTPKTHPNPPACPENSPPQVTAARGRCLIGEVGGAVDLDDQHPRQPCVVALRAAGSKHRRREPETAAPPTATRREVVVAVRSYPGPQRGNAGGTTSRGGLWYTFQHDKPSWVGTQNHTFRVSDNLTRRQLPGWGGRWGGVLRQCTWAGKWGVDPYHPSGQFSPES